MSSPSPRHLLELIQTPGAEWLATSIFRCGALALDQILHYGPFPSSEYPPPQRRDLIRSDLQRLTEAGYFSALTIPLIRPPLIGDQPIFRFRRGEREPDFPELAERLWQALPESSPCKPTKIYTFGSKIAELVAPSRFNDNAPDSPFSAHRRALSAHNVHPWVARLEQEQAQAPLLPQTDTVGRFEVRRILQNSLAGSLLNLAEVYLRTTAAGVDTRDWNVLVSPESVAGPIDFLAAFNRPDPNRHPGYFVWERVDPWGETDEVRRRDVDPDSDEWSRVDPWVAASRTASVFAQGQDAGVLEQFHRSIMLESHWRTIHSVYLNDGYELW